MTLSIPRIAEIIGAAPPRAGGTVAGWSIDSRTLNPGDCFIALKGPAHDGHDYLKQVFKHGAAAAIVERVDPNAGGTQLQVCDSVLALERLGRVVRAKWTGIAIAVTGSAGKTTTKDTIAALISVE